MVNFIHRAFIQALFLVTIPFIITTSAYAYTQTTWSNTTWAWSATGSWEKIVFTGAQLTQDDNPNIPPEVIITPGTLDITEDFNSFLRNPDNTFILNSDGKVVGTGTALYTGVGVLHEHGPEPGRAYFEMRMQWPIKIEITQEAVSVVDSDTGETYEFIKEARIYQTILKAPPETNQDKLLTNSYKKVVKKFGLSGVYSACDDTHPDYGQYVDYSVDPPIDFRYLCETEIGYGTEAFNPLDIFPLIKTLSGVDLPGNVGFYYDEFCTGFKRGDLDFNLGGQDFDLKEDKDGYFRSCEGRSAVIRVCFPDPDSEIFDCNVPNDDGQPRTIISSAIAGDRTEPAPPLPTTICIGPYVEDWLALSAKSGSGEDLTIIPCDPNQDSMILPMTFTDSFLKFTSAEADKAEIDYLQITGFESWPQQEIAVLLQDSPDRVSRFWDLSNMTLDVSSISGGPLDDIIITSTGNDVIVGGNGDDSLYGNLGDDCIDGWQNDDDIWLDAIPDNDNANADGRGADVAVFNCKLGKDTIHDFSIADGDRIVNTCGTPATVTGGAGGIYTVTIKGQNHAIVHVIDDGVDNGVMFTKGVHVVDGPLSDYPACDGYPK